MYSQICIFYVKADKAHQFSGGQSCSLSCNRAIIVHSILTGSVLYVLSLLLFLVDFRFLIAVHYFPSGGDTVFWDDEYGICFL